MSACVSVRVCVCVCVWVICISVSGVNLKANVGRTTKKKQTEHGSVWTHFVDSCRPTNKQIKCYLMAIKFQRVPAPFVFILHVCIQYLVTRVTRDPFNPRPVQPVIAFWWHITVTSCVLNFNSVESRYDQVNPLIDIKYRAWVMLMSARRNHDRYFWVIHFWTQHIDESFWGSGTCLTIII